MNAEINFYRQIFKDLMPVWSERGGYIEGFNGFEFLYPQNIAPIPVHFAPSSSLDGLLIDFEHSPSSPQMLANYLQTLSPGGIAIVHLSSKFWDKKKIYHTFNAAGLKILFFSKIPTLKHLHYDSGFFKTKGCLSRISLASFPFIPMSLKNDYFIVAKKNFYKNYVDNYLQFSVILVLPENKELAQRKLFAWEKFLLEHKIHHLELVIIENHGNEVKLTGQFFNQIQLIHHYESTFIENAIYSGIYKSKGKIIFVDLETSPQSPEIFFEVFDNFLKNPYTSIPMAIYAYPKQEKYQILKKIYNLLIYGVKHPSSKYRMYNQKSIEIFYKYHPYILKQNPYLIEKEIKNNKGKIIEIPYTIEYEPLKKKLSTAD